jgi:hypothetical protein
MWVPVAEYDRLLACEKRLNALQQHQNTAASDSLKGAGGRASELEGQGAATTNLVVPPGLAVIQNSFPPMVDTNCAPPPEIPNIRFRTTIDNTEHNLAEYHRDKEPPPPCPLNDPLGAQDPNLAPGRAPERQFVASPEQRGQNPSLGQPGTSATTVRDTAGKVVSQPKKWYFAGLDWNSGSEGEDSDDWDI